MAYAKSLDESKIIAALLTDIHMSHGVVFNKRAFRLTLSVFRRRYASEGMSFLTKTLPKLGKAFDKALSGAQPLTASELRWKSQPGSELPMFMGEFFSRVLHRDGTLLQEPCVNSVRIIRQLCTCFYKYELPYTDEQERSVVAKFERTEQDLSEFTSILDHLDRATADDPTLPVSRNSETSEFQEEQEKVVRRARSLLKGLFARFDPKDIYPKHGPGAVSTKEQLSEKYVWTNVSAKITEMYPLDEYFYTSLGHVCDRYQEIQSLGTESNPARVCLVPKDSRGPRLISCEPVDFQWIQQGLGSAIVRHVEQSYLTRYNVFFTDQRPNQIGALLGSQSEGKYSTLDLNEASDRVHNRLVHLLFPESIKPYLEACRSSSTVLPDGRVLTLEKFAPMGSCLCFPILALTIWAILTAGAPNTYTRERILVYGDDVIVPTAYAANAIELLESFGLKVNRDKSCIKGLFRESCGCDAFKGEEVTPVRIRTVWSSSRSPDVYTSWIAYANSFYDRCYYTVYNYIVECLTKQFGEIPSDDMFPHRDVPTLRVVTERQKTIRSRINADYQRVEHLVWSVKSPVAHQTVDGWSMLLRHFVEAANSRNAKIAPTWNDRDHPTVQAVLRDFRGITAFSVGTYTRRRASMLVRRWR